MNEHVLVPGRTTLSQLRDSPFRECKVELCRSARPVVEDAARLVRVAAASDHPVYGVNTGFGRLSSIRIAPEDADTLQRNLVRSHSSGVGEPCSAEVVRMMIVLKLLSLGRGASGVRWELIELLEAMANRNVLPIVPSQGSVGASGDLAPLAHLASVMMGEGEACFAGNVLAGAEALAGAGLEPMSLSAKEGLAMLNGTQFSTACSLVELFCAIRNAEAAIVCSCLTTDAMMASSSPLHPEIHRLRGHSGQSAVAEVMRTLMECSEIRASHLQDDDRVQDPYSIRCQAQVAGACLDLLRQAARTLVIEANAVTDNPLVFTREREIVSGGNFHAQPVAFAADQIALAIAELGSISQRRIALLVDPAFSYGLPPFLAANPGLESGYMSADVTSAALMSENKHLATPCSTDSTPTSANQEDHVSMAAHAACRLSQMNRNLSRILGIEAMCAVQGIEFRSPLKTGPALQAACERLRMEVPSLDQDRPLSEDIERAAALCAGGELADATGSAPAFDLDS